MSSERTLIARQRRSAYLLLAGAVLVEAVLLAIVVFEGAPVLLLVVGGLPAVVAAGFAVRAILAARRNTVLLDERERAAHRRAGQTSFWVLLAAIMTDEWARVLPAEHLHTSLLYVGVASIVAFTLYHRYVATPRGPVPRGPVRPDGESVRWRYTRKITCRLGAPD